MRQEVFVSELARVTRPGGKIVIVTWCHRNLDGSQLSPVENALLEAICSAYYLPKWVSESDYRKHMTQLGLSNISKQRDNFQPFFSFLLQLDQLVPSLLDACGISRKR